VTFAADIAPLVHEHCASCHRPGGVSFSLLSYEQLKSRAALIADVTSRRYMPPWRPEPGHGEFAGARRLTDEQIAMFRRWQEAGSPLGNPAAVPNPPSWTSGWQLGPPDLVVSMVDAYILQADGPDVYRNFVLPVGLQNKRHVRAWEFRPGSGAVHHATLHLDATRASRQFDERDPQPGYEGLVAHSARTPDGFFLDWAPGHTAFFQPKDLAWPVESGADLVMMLHLRPSGRPESVRASVALYFTDEPPSKLPVMVRLNRADLDIAAGVRDYTAAKGFTLPVDVDVYTVQPHAHYLAREVNAYATLPDGRTEPLVRIADWAFEWQDVYRYARPLFLPAGTVITMQWRYDNSDGNPRNPHHPPQRVTYGQRTSDEMSELWLQVVPRRSEDREKLVRAIRDSVLPQEISGHEMMLRADPDNAALHDDAALLYAEYGDIERALAHFQESLRIRPQAASSHYNVGTALLRLGRRDEAARYFREAIAIDPGYVPARRSLDALR
jgi:tetratricopeptide repeat protein